MKVSNQKCISVVVLIKPDFFLWRIKIETDIEEDNITIIVIGLNRKA
jgi:hypothetical protein